VSRTSVTVSTREPLSLANTAIVIVAFAAPWPPRSRRSVASTARRASSSCSSIRTLPR
jgi:hypothetical protein